MHGEARVKLFCVGQAQEKLLRTSDAAQLHIRWAHYQSRVWNQANCSSPILSGVTDMGWKRTDSHLVPHLLSLPPITRACSEIMSRGFTKGCLSCKTEKSIELNYIEGTCCLNLNTLMKIVHDNFVQQIVKRNCHVWFRSKYLNLGNRFPQYNCVQLPFLGLAIWSPAVAEKCTCHVYGWMLKYHTGQWS